MGINDIVPIELTE
jgi:hypothetical protein